MNLKPVYFDYNIYDGLAKARIHLPENYSQHFKIYVSVAHAEEFFNAVDKNNSEKNNEYLEKLYALLTSELNSRGVLNPSRRKVIYLPEDFKSTLQRVKNRDTRNTIEHDTKDICEFQKKMFELFCSQDELVKYNSTLSHEEIWKRPEVMSILANFHETIVNRNNSMFLNLLRDYSFEEALLSTIDGYLEPFDLEQNISKRESLTFHKLEFLIEFLQNVLNCCGYNKDNKPRKVKSGIYDTEHAIYATYCDYFVTEDEKLAKRLNAIYYFLGFETRCLPFEQWCNGIGDFPRYRFPCRW